MNWHRHRLRLSACSGGASQPPFAAPMPNETHPAGLKPDDEGDGGGRHADRRAQFYQSRRRRTRPEDVAAQKGDQWHFGMKAHIGMDAHSGLAHNAVSTAASVNDMTQHFDSFDAFFLRSTDPQFSKQATPPLTRAAWWPANSEVPPSSQARPAGIATRASDLAPKVPRTPDSGARSRGIPYDT